MMETADSAESPLPGELEEEQESPFRRRQRTVPVRRGRLWRFRRSLRWMVVGITVLPLLGYGGYCLAVFA